MEIHDSIKSRRQFIQTLLGKDEHIISLTCFPLLGCTNFTYPHHNPVDLSNRLTSLFFSDEIIYDNPLLKGLYRCRVARIDRKPEINVPIYKDKNTLSPFIEELPNREMSKPDHIFMDHHGFALGCCCIQVTFQCESLEQTCHLYDQLTPLGPIIMALSASSPIWRGYLSEIDCRWNVFKLAYDDRTKEELGLEPIKENRRVLKKCRFDATDVYLSREGSRYNDFEFDKDDKIHEQLMNENIEEGVANHFSNMFTRDPIALYKEAITEDDDELNTLSFDIFNSSNYR